MARDPVLVEMNSEERIMQTPAAISFRQPTPFWALRREASLNWLALGLLLAAWNAADTGWAQDDGARNVRRKPDTLRGYSPVSVRAVQRCRDSRRSL